MPFLGFRDFKTNALSFLKPEEDGVSSCHDSLDRLNYNLKLRLFESRYLAAGRNFVVGLTSKQRVSRVLFA